MRHAFQIYFPHRIIVFAGIGLPKGLDNFSALRRHWPEREPSGSPQLCHPDRNRSSQSDDLWSGGTLRPASSAGVNSLRQLLIPPNQHKGCPILVAHFATRVGGENLASDSISNDVIPIEAKRSGGTLRSASSAGVHSLRQLLFLPN